MSEERVPIFPDLTQEQAKQAEKAVEERNHVDYQAYLWLQRAVRFLDREDEEARELAEEAEEIIDEREKANNRFMAAVFSSNPRIAQAGKKQ